MNGMPGTEFTKEELAVFLKGWVQDVRGTRYVAFHALVDRMLVIVPTRSIRARKQRPIMTTTIFVIILMSALLAFLSPGGPQPLVLILGIVVATVLFIATRYAGIGRAGLDIYGFVRDIDREEASSLLENIRKTQRVHLPLIPCQRWHWDVEKIGRPYDVR